MSLAAVRTPRGIGRGGTVNAPPTAPSNGSGGEGALNIGPLNIAPVVGEIGDATTGRITLGMVNLTILALIGFYWWTRSAQGGG